MSDPKPTPTPTNDPRDKRSDNEHPINTGHPAVVPDGQYPPEEKTLGEMSGAVAHLSFGGGFTTPSGSRDNRNQAIVQVTIEAIKALSSGDDDGAKRLPGSRSSAGGDAQTEST